jgi:N utilization substance protein B
MTDQINISTRRKSRTMAMQALYQWAMSGDELQSIEAQYFEHNNLAKVDVEYFRDILFGVPKFLNEIDTAISEHIDRKLTEINPIELAVLRVATFELLKRLDIPYKVVIKEALNLAMSFGSSEGHKFVNGVLDKVAKQVRTVEIQSNPNG